MTRAQPAPKVKRKTAAERWAARELAELERRERAILASERALLASQPREGIELIDALWTKGQTR